MKGRNQYTQGKKRKHKLTGQNPQGGFMDSRHSIEQEAHAAMRDKPLEG